MIKIDKDLRRMNRRQLQLLIMEIRATTRKAGQEFGNNACWTDFVVAAGLSLPRRERLRFLQNLISIPKEIFLGNCDSFFSCFTRLGNFIRDVSARLR